jgi:endonuclease/exonuclease/phosphatase family metal-dependent hydrolase
VLEGQRFDIAAVVRTFDADIVVVPESWRPIDGESVLDPLYADGYAIERTQMAQMKPRRPPKKRHPGAGFWELAVCSRFPITATREVPIGSAPGDAISPRRALACTIDVRGTPLDVYAVHTSSKVMYGSPLVHLWHLARQLPQENGPAIVAGDCNFWGPGVVAILRGWRRAVRGRTWPAPRPHSQIDHILVNDKVEVRRGEVLPAAHSDHRPVRADLALLT